MGSSGVTSSKWAIGDDQAIPPLRVQAMESAHSSICCLLCHVVRLCQEGPRCGLPLSCGIEKVMLMAKLQEGLQWLHQSTELLTRCSPRTKWRGLVQCWVITRRCDKTTSIIALHALNFLGDILFMWGSRPMDLGWQLRRAHIFNGEGMGASLPYLWLSLAWREVALVCCVSPHSRNKLTLIKISMQPMFLSVSSTYFICEICSSQVEINIHMSSK